MLNHRGGRKKKAYTKGSSSLIELIPPDYFNGSDDSLSNGSASAKSSPQSDKITIEPPRNKESITNTSNEQDPVSTAEGDPEEPAKKINRNVGFNQFSGKKKKVLSISPKTEDQPQEQIKDENTQLSDQPKDNFGFDDLLEKWNSYANRMKHEGKTNLHTTLTKYNPELKADCTVVIQIDNAVQEEVLSTEKMLLLDFLRKELNNFSIQIETSLADSESGNLLYTTRDKFEKIASRNPSLNKLKDSLGLDLDY